MTRPSKIRKPARRVSMLSAKTRARSRDLQRRLAVELALAPREQLALALPSTSKKQLRPSPTCDQCGRRGYHLARCPRASEGT